ncbi:MAG: S8 family peptidase [Patescibacteria group bacterium]
MSKTLISRTLMFLSIILLSVMSFSTIEADAQVYNQNTQLYNKLYATLLKNKSVRIISSHRSTDTVSSLSSKRDYAIKNKDLLKVLFESGNRKIDYKSIQSKLPPLYGNVEELNKRIFPNFPEIGKNSIFSSFTPIVSTNIKSEADLKRLFSLNTLKILGEDKLLDTTIASSVPAVGGNDSWTRALTNSSIPDTGSNGTGLNKMIAILDTGVQNNHSAFAGKRFVEGCFSSSFAGESESVCPNGSSRQYGIDAAKPCNSGMGSCTHGTHVAGIALANSPTLKGVAKDADIMAVQVFSKITSNAICSGFSKPTPCYLTYNSAQIEGMNYVTLGVIVQAIFNTPSKLASANLSIGGGNQTTHCDDDPMKPSVDALKSVRIPTVISAGNSGQYGVGNPACISSAITVVNTNSASTPVISTTSQAHNTLADIAAPGTNIVSSIPNNTTGTKSGTSMAAPHVAGAMAILHGVFPSHSVDDNLKVLKDVGVSFNYTRNGITNSMKRAKLCKDYYLVLGNWTCTYPNWWFEDFPIFRF